MTRRVRISIFVPALAGFAALLYWALVGLPDFGDYRGPYGFVLNRIVVPERHTTNVVGATVFDYRGFDTMGEELILFSAVVGVVLLLRSSGESREEEAPTATVRSDALRVVGTLMVGGALLVGLWLVAFGYITPGGGFQGGVVIAGGAILLYLASSHKAFATFGSEELLDPIDATGAGGYIVIGIAALISGLPFLRNLLGPGIPGTLWSGGSIAFLNWASALEVAGANLILFSEFLQEYIVPLARRQM
jgi:multicomponent Na+:H+ antiporter subunit B